MLNDEIFIDKTRLFIEKSKHDMHNILCSMILEILMMKRFFFSKIKKDIKKLFEYNV